MAEDMGNSRRGTTPRLLGEVELEAKRISTSASDIASLSTIACSIPSFPLTKDHLSRTGGEIMTNERGESFEAMLASTVPVTKEEAQSKHHLAIRLLSDWRDRIRLVTH